MDIRGLVAGVLGRGLDLLCVYLIWSPTVRESRVFLAELLPSCRTVSRREFARREMEVVKVLQHPNLVKTLDVFDRSSTAPYAYIVMELLPHRDLATLIKLARSVSLVFLPKRAS